MPMIALTAYVMREHRAAIDAAGADGVIAKPILSIEQFGAEIRRFMRKRGTNCGQSDAVEGAPVDVALPVIDHNVFDTLAETIGPASMTELLGKLRPDLQSARDRLVRAIDPLDLGESRAVTHVLISVAGAVGAHRVQSLAKQINAAGHQGDAVAVGRDLHPLIGEIDRLLDHVLTLLGR
jgi:CheY-like chemotaxis protein